MLIFLLILVIWGFVVGGLARLALPGPDPMPWYATIGLGLAGSIVGGLVARIIFGSYGGGLIFAVLGAILLLYLYRRFVQGRGITGPTARRL